MHIGQRKTMWALNGLDLHDAARDAETEVVITRKGSTELGWPKFEVMCVGKDNLAYWGL